MFRWPHPTRPTLIVLAVLFSAVTVFASVLWMVAVRPPMPITVELGFDTSFDANSRTQRLDNVWFASPARRAGLRAGDRILAVDGQHLADDQTLNIAWSRHRPGDVVLLSVLKPGAPHPVDVQATFRAIPSGPLLAAFAQQVHDLFPVPFVIVGLTVLFLRLDNRNAWLLALLFACFVITPGVPDNYQALSPGLRAFALVFSSVSIGLVGPLFYFFFAVFPARSPFDRWWPWLKWVAMALGIVLAVPGIPEGGLRLPPMLAAIIGEVASGRVPIVFVLGCFLLGIAALATSFRVNADREVRRKVRVIFWGTLVGVVPPLAKLAVETFTPYRFPPAIATFVPLCGVLLPVSFAYAVVKHRVLEIPVLLRRSARYLFVQRGFTFLLSLVSIGLTLLFASWFTRYLQGDQQSWGISLGAVFGTGMLWSGRQVHRRVSGRIDRAFFRSAYDARVILEDLAGRSGQATDRAMLAHLLERHLVDALQPVSLAVYLQGADGQLRLVAGAVTDGLEKLANDDVMLAALAERGGPLEAPFATAVCQSPLSTLEPECLVPIVLRSQQLGGLLVLGRRLSDEPYSGEDRRLLASVAGQAATALENIALAEEIARRIESERRVAHEMDIARDVQARLLPETPPTLATLDCAARCIQARAVGGDCYDFLDLGPGRVGLVLADVSGKGIHAALLMANLQAHLRSQCGIVPFDPARMLEQVNRLLYRSTATQHYATVFFGIYDEKTRRLRYVNCGHNPPVLLPCAGGEPLRLMPTAPAIGLFEEWEASVGDAVVGAGDLLAVFSDGLTEATCGDAEFGEPRFIDKLRALRRQPAIEIVESILGAVQRFGGDAQSDDLTLLVARGIET